MIKHIVNLIFALLFIPGYVFCFDASDRKAIFTYYWDQHAWGGVSKSGTGSDLEQTIMIRKVLPELIEKLNCNILLDAPCGDLYWLQSIDLPVKQYIGIDIVEELIRRNQTLYSSDKFAFFCADLTQSNIPFADLILCRDCLVHLSYDDIKKIINGFKSSGSTYLLTTCFVLQTNNFDIPTGFWHPVNLQKEPFNFPEPLMIINENCTEEEGKWSDKSLVLWKLADIPNFDVN